MYLFLFGRDPKLSILEVFSYFKLNKISFSLIYFSEKYVIFDFKKFLDFQSLIKELGGTTRIYKIFFKSKKLDSNFLNNFDKEHTNKFNYAISYLDFSDKDYIFLKESLKAQFKKEKIKAVFKKPKIFDKKQKNTILNPNNFYSYALHKNGFELFACKLDNFYYIGYAIACFNPKEFVLKDKLRPEQKELYSTSFRLTKIMINLLSLKKNKRVLDPFCGFGNFLIEGLYLGYNVLGIDKDKNMVNSAKKNLEWAKSYYKLKNDFTILHGDSSKLNFSVDGVVFEPYMGHFLSKLPNFLKAKKDVVFLEKLYFDVFKNLNKNLKPKTKVVCILPEFKTHDNQTLKISFNVFLKNNFSLYNFKNINEVIDFENPIFYTTPKESKINRYIFILEKN